MAPWAAAIVATIAAGTFADMLVNRRVLPLTWVRKLMQAIGSFGPAACLFYLAVIATVRMPVGAGPSRCTSPGFACTPSV